MDVILNKEVSKLGLPGDIKTVKDGYARNYLLPFGYAQKATEKNLKHLEKMRASYADEIERIKHEAMTLKEKVEETALTISVKVGEKGKLYGSVTSTDIAEKLKETVGVDLDKRKIELKEPMRQLGDYEVLVQLPGNTEANIKVSVVANE